MLVQDPNKKGKKPEHQTLVDEIMKQAAENGEKAVEFRNKAESQARAFKGTGYKLGSDEVPSEEVKTAVDNTSSDSEGEVVECMLTFWKDGFSADDGPLMRYDDPANQAMLERIKAGAAPLSLFKVKLNQRAEIKVVHRTQEAYVPPPKVLKPFSGSGQRLGSVVPSAGAPAHTPAASAPAAPAVQLNVDANLPSTSIQIRLADGTRMVTRLNMSHTVNDIRQFINNSRPGESARAYQLQTQFPVQTLEDNKTLTESKLSNAVVFQKYT
jgi:UBX domain-containing protein 1